MKFSAQGNLRRAVYVMFAAGFGSAGLSSAPAMAQTDASATNNKATELQGVSVTGSRIRRVDKETASPVYVLDHAAIEKTDAQTIGDLIQQIPTIAGAATNPAANNGGGDGETHVSLRGLGEDRTLLLIDGQRIVTQDVNALPISVVDRLEILKEGASAIYGSDAIGGVVNIITRKNFKGVELTADTGISSKGDGRRQQYSATLGTASDKGHFLVGLNYNKQDLIPASHRNFSGHSLYLYSSTVFVGGSSRNPNGRFYLPTGVTALGTAYGDGKTDPTTGQPDQCTSLVRKTGATGSTLGATPATGDYTCYTGAYAFNFQDYGNVIMTPQERYGLFAEGAYDINDHVTAYEEFWHNTTQADSQIAPLPFDANADNIIISKDSYYNPFGYDFGGASGSNPNLLTRFVGNNRVNKFETQTDQINFGAKGDLYGWEWDANFGYGRKDQIDRVSGYFNFDTLQQEVGPSFLDTTTNTVTCGTAAAPIANCTPYDAFNIGTTPGALSSIEENVQNSSITQLKSAALNINGDLGDTIRLPGGKIGIAGGFEYLEHSLKSYADPVALAHVDSLTGAITCGISNEACTGETNGSFDSTDFYAEALMPILKDLPGIKALTLTADGRLSHYNNFGSTANYNLGLEYRPVSDLLLRASWAKVFRAPTITDLFSPASSSSLTFNDPCNGLTAAKVASNPNYSILCQNVPTDGSFKQQTSQATGILSGNPKLMPEGGHVVTFGAVYDPWFVKGLSLNIDFWHYGINNEIEAPDVNYIVQQVLAGGAASGYANAFTRYPASGQVGHITSMESNLGLIETDGFDTGFKYSLPKMPWGQVRIGVDATFTNEFNNTNNGSTVHYAGTDNLQFGEFSRWRGLGTISWANWGFDAQWTVRYMSGFQVPNQGVQDAQSAPGFTGLKNYPLNIGAQIYDNVEVGYNVKQTDTHISIGVDNLFDQPPPILYTNNFLNANTDVNNFDTVGTYFWLHITQKFK